MFQAEPQSAARRALVRRHRRSIVTAAITCVRWLVGVDMTLTNLGLWVILAALLALIPCGCIMTRPSKKDAPQADKGP